MARTRQDEPAVEELVEDTETEDDEDTDETLLSKITEITGLEREEDEKAEAFKERIVRHFADKYPNTEEGNAAFGELPNDVTNWVDAATEIARANRGARNKKPLPELQGLEEDEQPARRGRTRADGEKADKPARKKAEGSPFAPRALAATFEAAPADAKISKFLSKELKAADYHREKERSADGHIVYRHKSGSEVHVGPGKQEHVYMMGWRIPGDKQHGYGGEGLKKRLAEVAAS